MALSLACKSLPGTLRCGASKALRARGSPPSHSILLDLDPSQMVQGISGPHGTRLQGEWSRVERFSVKPGKVRVTTLKEARDGLDQDAKGRWAQLATGVAQRYGTLSPALAGVTVGALRGLTPQDATSSASCGKVLGGVDAMRTQQDPKRAQRTRPAPHQAPGIICACLVALQGGATSGPPRPATDHPRAVRGPCGPSAAVP
jgi:hypothetical protein